MFGKTISVRPAGVRAVARAPLRAPVRAEPNVEKAIADAQEACKDDPKAKECANAWDDVEELSAAASHKKAAEDAKDPLEKYCETAPDADECRVYED